MEYTPEYNRELIEKYPFLMPYNRWTGKTHEDFDYSYTELDAMPEGWRKAFGEQMCEDIKNSLIEAESKRTDTPERRRELVEYGCIDPPSDAPDDYLHVFRFTQIKEKYGTLRLYTNWVVGDLDKVLLKYEHMSEDICIGCGAPATKVSLGWISPWCDNCASGLRYEKLMDISEYYKDEPENE